MKKISLIIILTIWMGSISAQSKQGKGEIEFEKTSHNFGNLREENGKVEIVFPFKNTGEDTLRLTDVKASCGCTTPSWSRKPILPGEEGFIKATYNPLNRPGPFNKTIMVFSDGTPAYKQLSISGKVIPREKGPKELYPFEEGNIRMKTNHLTFGAIYDDEKPTKGTILYNQGRETIIINLAETEIPEYLRFYNMEEKVELKPGEMIEIKIEYDATVKKDYGFVFEYLFLKTNDEKKPLKRLNLSAEIKERFHLNSSQKAAAPHIYLSKTWHDFGKVVQGEKLAIEIPIKNTGKTPLKIRKISVSCGCTKVVLRKYEIQPGETMPMTVFFDTKGRLHKQQKEITIICNDPNKPVSRIKILAEISAN